MSLRPPNDTRARIIGSTAGLFQRHGYTGTGLKQISAESGAPFGSLYHFFPGGKEELAADTLRWSGTGYQLLVEAVLENAPDLLTGLQDCFAGAADVLVATDFADACPIETVALEVASTNERLRLVTADIFDGWIDAITAHLEAGGVTRREARDLGIAFLAALEGAFVLARALKSTEPMYAAARATVAATQAALDPSNAGTDGETMTPDPVRRDR
ncbi:MAG TPA: TetR/AcrR family transcriptional regulator [Acidimicrobiia bacterium]|nr:TetR/AcrR family transcriptional regulator [Acidimicrobiia bacterium]